MPRMDLENFGEGRCRSRSYCAKKKFGARYGGQTCQREHFSEGSQHAMASRIQGAIVAHL